MSMIRNLHAESTTYHVLNSTYNGTKWTWTLAGDEEHDGEPRYIYHTDSAGEGMFYYDRKRGEDKQIEGTCQFFACRTASGMRRKLEKYFAD